MTSRWGRILQGVGIAIAVAILVVTARGAWKELVGHPVPVAAGRATVAVIALACAYLVFAWVWRQVAGEIGVQVSYRAAIQLWSFSNLGRYVPGKIWQVVGLVVIARDLGLPAGAAASVAVIVLTFMVGSGALFTLLTAWDVLASKALAGVVVTFASALLVPAIWPGLISWGLSRLPASLRMASVPRVERRAVFRLVAYFCFVWMVQGATFVLFVSAFAEVGWADAPRLGGAYSLAYIGGLVALFAPGGVGVREGLLAGLLGACEIDGLATHSVALAARLWNIGGEVLVLGLAVALRTGTAGRNA